MAVEETAFRISVERDGVYAVTHAELRAAGLAAGPQAVDGIALYQRGEAVPLWIEDGADGLFGDGDRLTEVEKVRARVQVLSASRDQQVEVKFRDNTKVKGYITAVEPVSFNLKDPKSGTSQSIAYSEVDSVNKASGSVSTRTWLIIGGVAAGVATTVLIVKPALCDGGAQTRGAC
jgi:hypothetical protein